MQETVRNVRDLARVISKLADMRAEGPLVSSSNPADLWNIHGSHIPNGFAGHYTGLRVHVDLDENLAVALENLGFDLKFKDPRSAFPFYFFTGKAGEVIHLEEGYDLWVISTRYANI